MSASQPILALVPARGGSKGVPRKNLAPVGGRLLLDYTLEAALGCESIDACFLSSDDAEILEVGRRSGVRVIQRPPEFSTDQASAIDVVRHFLDVLPPEFAAGDPLIVYLQPTSPLRRAAHVAEALRMLERADATTLVSVVELEKSPFKAFKLDADGRLQSLFDERLSNARRQDLPRAYVPNGAIYIFSRRDFLAHGGFPSTGSIPFVMSAEESIDIDVREDLVRVERILGATHG